MINTIKNKISFQSAISTESAYDSQISATEPNTNTTPNSNSVKNRNLIQKPELHQLEIKTGTGATSSISSNLTKKIVQNSVKYQTQGFNKNSINYIKSSGDFGKKKHPEVIEIVENMVMKEKTTEREYERPLKTEYEKPITTEERIRKMISVDIAPEKKDNIFDTDIQYEFRKDSLKNRNKEGVKDNVRENTKKLSDKFDDIDIKPKTSSGITTIGDKQLNYKILSTRENTKPRAKSPVINYNNLALKSKIKQLSTKDMNDLKIFKNPNVNPERASKKITLDLGNGTASSQIIPKKEINKESDSTRNRNHTEIEMKEETQASQTSAKLPKKENLFQGNGTLQLISEPNILSFNKNRSSTMEKAGDPISSRIHNTTKVVLKEKDTLKLLSGSNISSIKGKPGSNQTNQIDISKDINNVILLDKLQKACNLYSYGIKEVMIKF